MLRKYLQPLRTIDPYTFLRPLLFCMEAEAAHSLAIRALKAGLGYKLQAKDETNLFTTVCGLRFSNPVGLAAGFDKQAEVTTELFDLGFGFVELGTVTPLPQPGNPKPRVWRVEDAEAIINRFGFNSIGAEAFAQRFNAWVDTVGPTRKITGINIGKNKESEDAVSDYVTGVRQFARLADYLTVNISSPSTAGLRDLHKRGELADLLKGVLEARAASGKKPPVFLKIAPDQTDQQEEGIAQVAMDLGIDGLIISNTSMTLAPEFRPEFKGQLGGLSGRPLFDVSTQLLSRMYKRTGGRLPMIGVGGIFSGADAYAKIRAGASLVQLYTGLIYKGPSIVGRIRRELSDLLKKDRLTSVEEAVGADHRRA